MWAARRTRATVKIFMIVRHQLRIQSPPIIDLKVLTIVGHPVPSGIDGPDLRRRHQLGDGSEPQVEKVRGGGGSNVGQRASGRERR